MLPAIVPSYPVLCQLCHSFIELLCFPSPVSLALFCYYASLASLHPDCNLTLMLLRSFSIGHRCEQLILLLFLLYDNRLKGISCDLYRHCEAYTAMVIQGADAAIPVCLQAVCVLLDNKCCAQYRNFERQLTSFFAGLSLLCRYHFVDQHVLSLFSCLSAHLLFWRPR